MLIRHVKVYFATSAEADQLPEFNCTFVQCADIEDKAILLRFPVTCRTIPIRRGFIISDEKYKYDHHVLVVPGSPLLHRALGEVERFPVVVKVEEEPEIVDVNYFPVSSCTLLNSAAVKRNLPAPP